MIDLDLITELIDKHIESKGCSLFGRARDVGTEKARRRVAEDLASGFLEPVLKAYLARQAHPAGSSTPHRADPDTWLTRDDATGGLLGASQAKSSPGSLGSESSNEDAVTPLSGATKADQANPPWHHSRETWREYLRRTGRDSRAL
jgi:hypothetical protein